MSQNVGWRLDENCFVGRQGCRSAALAVCQELDRILPTVAARALIAVTGPGGTSYAFPD